MPKPLTRLPFVGLLMAGVVSLSGCSVLESLGLGGADTIVDEATGDEVQAPEVSGDAGTPATPIGFVMPTCDTLYSDEQTAELLARQRVSIGENLDGDYGYGTVNLELVELLQNVRTDLKLSCTWYLPASESASITTVAIIDAEGEEIVNTILGESGALTQSVGGGTLWTIASATEEESPDYLATEAHFLAPVPCPTSLAATTCIGWFTTHYSFGQAEELTIDAARKLEVYN